jgi:hypothetical protein
VPDAPKFLDAQIREEIFQQYGIHNPRAGIEMDSFVRSQCEYFGIEPRKCQKIIGDARAAQEAAFRGGIQTASQSIAEAMGFTRAEIIDVIRDSMRATRRRPILDGGKPVLGADGLPLFFEQPDHANRIAAADKAAKMLGAYAPKELRVEAHHEHNVTISDEQLVLEFAGIARGLGLSVVDAVCKVVEPGPAAHAAGAPPVQDREGGEGLLLLADDADRDD